MKKIGIFTSVILILYVKNMSQFCFEFLHVAVAVVMAVVPASRDLPSHHQLH